MIIIKENGSRGPLNIHDEVGVVWTSLELVKILEITKAK